MSEEIHKIPGIKKEKDTWLSSFSQQRMETQGDVSVWDFNSKEEKKQEKKKDGTTAPTIHLGSVQVYVGGANSKQAHGKSKFAGFT